MAPSLLIHSSEILYDLSFEQSRENTLSQFRTI